MLIDGFGLGIGFYIFGYGGQGGDDNPLFSPA